MKTFLTKDIILDTFFGAATGVITVLLFAGMLSLTSCSKTPDFDTPEPTPKTEQAIIQSFGLYTSTQISPMTAKSWDKATWTYNFSTIPATLTLSGVGNPNVYTKNVTVAELKAGTVSLNMLPGTYDVTYETIHTQCGVDFSINGTNLPLNQIGNVLDIKIANSITVTGTPVLLTATLEDALIVVDIPNTNQVERHLSLASTSAGTPVPLLINSVPTIHYAYVDKATWLRVFVTATSPKVVDMSNIMKGQAYHLVTPFGATVNLIVPDMVVNTVII